MTNYLLELLRWDSRQEEGDFPYNLNEFVSDNPSLFYAGKAVFGGGDPETALDDLMRSAGYVNYLSDTCVDLLGTDKKYEYEGRLYHHDEDDRSLRKLFFRVRIQELTYESKYSVGWEYLTQEQKATFLSKHGLLVQ